MKINKEDKATTQGLLNFIDESPTPFHAVCEAVAVLEKAGFKELHENASWKAEKNGRYYVVRHETTLAAFVLGEEPLWESGMHIVGAHTDSPNLRLKPQPAYCKEGYVQLGVEIYGGVLLSTWTDRDLGLAGRVIVGDGAGGIRRALIKVDEALARVPQLAIHLNRNVNDKGLILNKQDHMPPIIGLAENANVFSHWLDEQVSLETGEYILSFDLMLHPLEKPSFIGLADEFICSPRLENLAMCHAGLVALCAESKAASPRTRMIVVYDHEEIGSATTQGAAGSFLSDTLKRLVSVQGGDSEADCRLRSNSLLLSADMAHAVHPNYAGHHDSQHSPRMNAGPCIKINANARYATDAATAAAFEVLCKKADVPVQRFVSRSDIPCGSTIGPLSATRVGIPTVDIGNPMLSMHSAREMAGSLDHPLMIKALRSFLR